MGTGQDGARIAALSTAADAESNQQDTAACSNATPAGLRSSNTIAAQLDDMKLEPASAPPGFELVDWVRTYPTFRFGGVEGTRVCTAAFRKKAHR